MGSPKLLLGMWMPLSPPIFRLSHLTLARTSVRSLTGTSLDPPTPLDSKLLDPSCSFPSCSFTSNSTSYLLICSNLTKLGQAELGAVHSRQPAPPPSQSNSRSITANWGFQVQAPAKTDRSRKILICYLAISPSEFTQQPVPWNTKDHPLGLLSVAFHLDIGGAQ